jgi:hypothetical protein
MLRSNGNRAGGNEIKSRLIEEITREKAFRFSSFSQLEPNSFYWTGEDPLFVVLY